jgi:hypothetical protein
VSPYNRTRHSSHHLKPRGPMDFESPDFRVSNPGLRHYTIRTSLDLSIHRSKSDLRLRRVTALLVVHLSVWDTYGLLSRIQVTCQVVSPGHGPEGPSHFKNLKSLPYGAANEIDEVRSSSGPLRSMYTVCKMCRNSDRLTFPGPDTQSLSLATLHGLVTSHPAYPPLSCGMTVR